MGRIKKWQCGVKEAALDLGSSEEIRRSSTLLSATIKINW